MDEIQTKVLRVFLLAIHSHLYRFDLRFLFLQIHATSYSFYSSVLYAVKEEVGKPNRKPYPLLYGVRNPYRNLMSENSQDYAQKPQRNCAFKNSASDQSAASGLVSSSNQVERQENVVVTSWILFYLLSRLSVFIIIKLVNS